MTGIRVDPDEVLRFANDLQGASILISGETNSVSSSFEDLREAWGDARYDQFARTFEETIQVLRGFSAEAERYADFLREKARLAEEYLYR
jgi:uncharacterized protein YukE